jgi:hypothetical protein
MKTAAKILVLTAFFNLLFSHVSSQIIVPGSESLLAKLRLNEGVKGIQTLMYSDVTGNPFIFKDFRIATVITNSGERFETPIRYDIYANEVHFIHNYIVYAILHPEKIKSIETDSLKFIYTEFVKSKGEQLSDGKSYFIVVNDGEARLLIRKHMRVQDPEPPKLYQNAKPAKFIPLSESYYLKKGDDAAVLIRSAKDVLAVLNDQKDQVDKFIRANKINFRKADDIAKVVRYYNNL